MKAAFHGCSFTLGEGFLVEQRPLYIYPSLVAKQLNLQHENLAQGGNSNYRIFMQAAKSLLSKNYDIVFCQWSALNRIWLYPGPDCELFSNSENTEFRYRDIYLSPKQKRNFCDLLSLLNHDYKNIFELIDYCVILESMSKASGTKLYHINGLVPWESDLASNKISIDILSTYTKSILDFDNRCDDEIMSLFEQLHTKFQSINQSLWINLFDSFQKSIIDIGPQGHHPGIKSHEWMANKIYNYIS